MRIGVLALQGDYEAHAGKLAAIGADSFFVRTVDDLDSIDGLIIPGGESTTVLNLLARDGMGEALRGLPGQGKPVFGTCAGAILLASEVTNPSQPSLGLIDMTIARNGYGRQLDSDIKPGEAMGQAESVEMVFIRAPRIERVGDGVDVLGRCDGEVVCVRQGNSLAATFHPELSESKWLHEYFAEMVRATERVTAQAAAGELAANSTA